MDRSMLSDARIGAHARGLLADASAQTGLWLSAFLAAHGGTLRAIGESAAMRRLSGVSQLGLKRGTRGVPAVMVPFCAGRAGETTELPPISRREHSEQVCATMLAHCALHDLSGVDALHAAIGALCHDLGHPAFSHTLEPLLRRHGREDHEAAGQRLLVEDPELREALARGRVDVRRVVAVMREEGDLGLRQKVVDTCGYLRHDARAAGFAFAHAFVIDLLRSLRTVRDGAFEVEDTFLLEQFLEYRAMLAAELYEHPYNRVNSLLLRGAADWLLSERNMPIEAVATGRDEDVLRALETEVCAGAPAWVVSARRFLLGRPREARLWKIVRRESDNAASADAAKGTANRPAFVLSPIDFTGKSVPVRLPDGSVFHVRANATRPDHHCHWHVVSYAGPV